jgi:PhzF family phenazine biosynthesis protein
LETDVPSPIFCVDAFTERPFAGNPAGVCLLDSARPESWMRSVAAEMNLAETAFLEPRGGDFHLRWFTPTTEVDLCGHATLASAHVLWTEERVAPDASIRFHTKSGVLTAARAGDLIELDFPSEPPVAGPAPDGLAAALGVIPTWVGRNRMDYLVEVASEEIVRRLMPDMKALGAIEGRGVIVTARSASPSHDFVSRFFGPAVGVDEDPVTGSAHCCLGPYWAEKLGKTDLLGYQASARGGTVRVSVRHPRVILGGRAVTVYRGALLI